LTRALMPIWSIAKPQMILGERSTLEERSHLVLDFARVLYVNGQATDQMVAAVERLGRTLGLHVSIVPRWGDLQLQIADGDAMFISEVAANPAGVAMDRVALAMHAIDEVGAGGPALAAAMKSIRAIAHAPPAATSLFVVAAAAGAVALSVLFGVEHLSTTAIICVSAGLGAALRRAVARISTNVFLQPFSAALLAGIVGALAARYPLSSSLRLVAVCPCMVLVPGPHILNAAMDLVRARIHLGTDRMIYAGLVILAISIGLVVGFALLGVTLPVDPPGRSVPLWQDIIASGIAVASYSVFFATPLRMLPWPVAVGMFAHALRWVLLTVLGLSVTIGAFGACLVVGLVLTPVSRRSNMPFAAIGFASVVSMMPGVYLFRMASGLLQSAHSARTSFESFELLHGAVADGTTAVSIVLAMSLGLVVPKLIIDHLSDGSSQHG
jgi:uncharacterized membrane protein YjjP (DUF1212 family)